jgi:uncharacterized membrane protein YphA (DoxX/SURF4 family)
MNSSAVLAFLAMPSTVLWSYFVGGVVFVIGLVTIFRGDWQKARGFDKLILFGPVFYAAPIACFGTEHFTITKEIASMVPRWLPWHMFWAYFVGTCFIAAGFSLVTRIQWRLAARLLALTFFLFVVLMDAPDLARIPHNRFLQALMLRELSFCAGPLALAASFTGPGRERVRRIVTTIARYLITIPVLFYSYEQFLHADYVPGIPLDKVTPHYVYGNAIWTYLTAAVYAVAGIFLLIDRKTRTAAASAGLSVLWVVLVVYVPIAVVEHTDLEGLNFLFDTLMYGGTVLLLAGAMPRES